MHTSAVHTRTMSDPPVEDGERIFEAQDERDRVPISICQ